MLLFADHERLHELGGRGGARGRGRAADGGPGDPLGGGGPRVPAGLLHRLGQGVVPQINPSVPQPVV